MMIIERIEVSDEILAFGGFGDVRDGRYGEVRVAVKAARVPFQRDLGKTREVTIHGISPSTRSVNHLLQRFYNEVILRSTLSHPNILRLFGAQEDVEKRQFATVSEWMDGGNIMEFIKGNHANRLELVGGSLPPQLPY